MPTSGAIGAIIASRLSSFSALSWTSCGSPALMICSRTSLISCWKTSSSPSSFWMIAHLLAQVNLALGAIHLLMHLAGDLVLQFQHAQFLTEQFGDAIQPLLDVERLQQPLALLGGQRQRRGDQVGQPAGIVGVEGVEQHLFRDVVVQFNRALEQVQHRLHGGVGLARVRVDLRQRARFGDQVRARLGEAHDLDAAAPLPERAEAVVRHSQDAPERDLDADGVELVRAGVDRVRVDLRDADHGLLRRPASLRRR